MVFLYVFLQVLVSFLITNNTGADDLVAVWHLLVKRILIITTLLNSALRTFDSGYLSVLMLSHLKLFSDWQLE